MRENLVQLLKFSKKENQGIKRDLFALSTLDRHRKLCYYVVYMQMIWVWGLNVRTFLYTFWPKIEL